MKIGTMIKACLIGINFKKIVSTFFVSLALLSLAQAEIVPGFSVFKPTKYAKPVPHFDYVNPNAPKGGQLRLNAATYGDSLNPYSYKTKPVAGLTRTFATLMARAEDEEASCYAYAASGVEFSADGKSFTYYLRPEATFHDGTPITPQDVIATYDILKHPSMPMYGALLASVEKVEPVGNLGVKFTLKEGHTKEAAFVIGTELFILSKKDLELKGFMNSKTPFLGSGPYKIIYFKPNFSMITYQRVPDWWGATLPSNKGKYNFDEITYFHYFNSQAAFEAFKAGELDVRQEMRSSIWYTAYDFPAVTQGRVIKAELPHPRTSGMLGFIFNLRRPMFQDLRVRKALSLMLDFDWLNNNLFYNSFVRLQSFFTGTEFESKGLISPEEVKVLDKYRDQLPKEIFSEAFKPGVMDKQGRDRDAKRLALELLAQAGWKYEKGRLINQQTKEQMHVRILLPSQTYKRVVHSFQRDLQHLGISVELLMPDSAHYQEIIEQRQFDLIAGGWFPMFEVPFNKQELFWHSKHALAKGTKNIGGVKDSVVDSLLAQIRTEKDEVKLKVLMRAFDRVLLHNYFVIPQWRSKAYWVAYWNKFGRPEIQLYHGFGLDTWWQLDNKL